MKSLVIPPTIEKEVDNDLFKAVFTRQHDGRLQGHVTYYKWTPAAKRRSKELLDTFDEPVFGAVQDQKQLKYLLNLGFEHTGRLLACEYPGKEGTVMGEVSYIKGGTYAYSLRSYEELGQAVLPFEELDGLGKIEALEDWLATQPPASWETKHYFSDGVYTRETFVKGGTLFVGYKHRRATVCMITSGVMSIIVVDSSGHAEDKGTVHGPSVFTTAENTRKAIFAHEDSIIMNSFPLEGLPQEYHNKESVEMIEAYIFDKAGELCLE